MDNVRRMKRLLVPVLFLAIACAEERPAAPPTDTREAIETLYVAAPELPVRTQASESAPVITKYQIGEAVSILAKNGEWAEIRTGDTSGWVRLSDLHTAKEQAAGEENPTPKFQKMPMPVTAPSAHGEIYIEADVNTDGDVTSTRILSNTTGSDLLATQNAEKLKGSKFYPLSIKGERKTFKYYHKVTY